MGLAGHTTTHEFEILSAGEVFDRVDAAYIVGLEAGIIPLREKIMQTGKVKVTEWTNYSYRQDSELPPWVFLCSYAEPFGHRHIRI